MDTVVIPADVSMVEQSFSYEYPNRDATKWKRKYSVSELKTLSQTTLPEEESSIMMDLAGKQRNTVAPDLPEYILKTKGLSVALRKARDLDVKEEEWIKFIEEIEKER